MVDSHSPVTAEARATLTRYLEARLELDLLIDWAQRLEASAPRDPWLRRTAQALADPLLCRERATALVRDLLDG